MFYPRQLIEKFLIKRSLFTQILFTLLAFIAMVVFSSMFQSAVVRRNLVRNATSILDFTEEKVTASLLEPKTTLQGFAETVTSMISQGCSVETLQNYIDDISDYLLLSGQTTFNSRGLFGYFETLPGGPRLLRNKRWNPALDYQAEERQWYQLAVANPGVLVETIPYKNSAGETSFTYALSIFDTAGIKLGVVCIDVRINAIGADIVHTALNQNGYGMLINQDFILLAHPHEAFVSTSLRDPEIPVSIFADAIEAGEEVFERNVTSFRDEPAVAFFRKLSNGWYLGLVTPKEQYYSSVTYMKMVLTILGGLLASALIVVLIRIDAAKDRSDTESKQKSAFLANMSHEIRTPINAIIGMTTIGKSAEDAQRKDYCFEKIEDASQHLLGIINDVLDMSKIDAEKFQLSPTEFQFDKLMQRVMNVISFRIEGKRQTLNTIIDRNIPANLIGDDQRLAQVIINLLSNAVKFTPDGGIITLNAYLLSETNNICLIVVEITDTGIGIAPEHQVKLFRSFEQADNGTARKFGGTGLGLVISKRIVEMMGGTIGVVSTPGEGSTFTFSFQAIRAPDTPEEDTRNAQDEPIAPLEEFAGCHILLAEDVEINREIILAYMEDTGAEIDCAENGIETLKKFDENPGKYDLVFMDVQMPEMDGLETTRRLRARGETLPIIAMTANVFKEDVERCIAAGMNDHIGKPLDMEDVLNMARKYWKPELVKE